MEVFEKKILKRLFGPYRDVPVKEWTIRYNHKLQDFFQHTSIARATPIRRIKLAAYACRMQGSIVSIVIENYRTRKRPLRRFRFR